MSVNITTSRKLTTSTYGLTVGEIRKLIDGIPDSTKVSVDFYKADYRDPRESDQLTLTVKEN